ncbi:hypothetical protein Bequi_09950 [Brachybacterium sp. JHP9]|uniref:Uncharacterized protein n=1 Tax=Brachybacterium equifaecis TaxID=2910770 RepID=A0ABT0R1A6_9MICO|nr:hypothetical protein [Brachybacterium equifaecis]MCL6423706.1 hypothetical protein [Brachybacterium equifaecis]
MSTFPSALDRSSADRPAPRRPRRTQPFVRIPSTPAEQSTPVQTEGFADSARPRTAVRRAANIVASWVLCLAIAGWLIAGIAANADAYAAGLPGSLLLLLVAVPAGAGLFAGLSHVAVDFALSRRAGGERR